MKKLIKVIAFGLILTSLSVSLLNVNIKEPSMLLSNKQENNIEETKEHEYDLNNRETIKKLGWEKINGGYKLKQIPIHIRTVPKELPKHITSLNSVFKENISDKIEGIQYWDTSNITDMSNMFESAQWFDQDISNWNTSKVTNMSSMFYDAKLFNKNISKWDISHVTNISRMFWGASSFDQDLSKWNTTSVINFASFSDNQNKNFILPKVEIKNNRVRTLINVFPELLKALENKSNSVKYLGLSNFQINSPITIKAQNTKLVEELNFSISSFNDLEKEFNQNTKNTTFEKLKEGYKIKLSNRSKLYSIFFKKNNSLTDNDHEHILLFTSPMKPIVLKNYINVINTNNIIAELKNTDSSFKNVDLEVKNNTIINNQAIIKLKSTHDLYEDEIRVIFNNKSKFFKDNKYIILLGVLGSGFLISSLGWLTYSLIKRKNK
ncbi:BspA family leucine-rich repeat surface protein [Mycoplasma capricolum]|uniref:BspA family leucine-rich repeat surface protein n=1 Tax=Mycoplasma capricolum TaxID=2095 RepID=UPI000639138D|nr:BspA family leucine-rich repeat surface protein [Mycoplasma capricolum]KKW61751.1 Chitinase [Mycoplasma capricolum subsp. capricolum]